jgi:hypothetical protein
MVEVRYNGRLGNAMFQYCLGRIIAEELGFALQAQPIDGFPETSAAVRGVSYASPVKTYEGQQLPIGEILNDGSARRVLLNGWFQQAEYYRPFREKILRWMSFGPEIRVPEVTADVVVNVRRTDYIKYRWALPFSYYETAIERVLPAGGSVCVVTDDSRDPFFRNFKKWRPTFFDAPPLEQMRYMSRAPKLIMSQSSFSWWPAFLADAQTTVCPVPSQGCWAPAGGVGLIERDRFICIESPELYRENFSDRLRWKKRGLMRRAKALLGLS